MEFREEYEKLVETINAYHNGNKMGRAAAILRFTFVVDAALGVIKELLTDRCISCHNTREILSQAVSQGLIADEQTWLRMIFDREHIDESWDEGVADVIFENIDHHYLSCLNALIEITDTMKNG